MNVTSSRQRCSVDGSAPATCVIHHQDRCQRWGLWGQMGLVVLLYTRRSLSSSEVNWALLAGTLWCCDDDFFPFKKQYARIPSIMAIATAKRAAIAIIPVKEIIHFKNGREWCCDNRKAKTCWKSKRILNEGVDTCLALRHTAINLSLLNKLIFTWNVEKHFVKHDYVYINKLV